MTFDEFANSCSADFIETDDNKTEILVIFSTGMRQEFSSDFVEANPEVAKRLVANDLYNYTKEQFK